MRFHACRIAAFLVILLALGGSRRVSAQVLKGQILGTVTDQTGAVAPDVKITITEVRTNFVRTTEANGVGNYFAVNLDPGEYRVEAEKAGFTRAARAGIDLQPNTTVRVNFELTAGAVTQTVDVTANVTILQTDRADTGGKIEARQLQQAPLLFNRNYAGLLVLGPGVGRPTREHSEFYNSQDSLSVRVNGQGRQFTNFQIEGIENKIDNGNLTALVPPAEAIQTVDISTSNFDPEFGNAGGAVTNVTLRSGTNDYHGSLFQFHRNENIQARNTFAITKAPTVYNQFGGTVGGRIIRDKLFFFADYQGSRDHLGTANRATIPSLPFRTGNLSGGNTVLYDPTTGDATGRGRTVFAGNIIPASRISPISRRILGFIPNPNLAAVQEGQNNYEQNTVRVKTLDQTDAKVDWVMSPSDRLAVRYSFQKAVVSDPGLYGDGGIYGGPRGGGFGGQGPARTQSPGITYSKVFTPTFVWESRVGVVRNRNDARNSDYGKKTSEEIGIRGVNLDDWTSGLTEIRINGYTTPVVGFSPSLPWARSVTTFGVVNNFSKTYDRHIIRFGMEIRRERNDLLQTQTFNPRGRFEYEPGQTGDAADTRRNFANAFAAFLLDLPNQSGRDLPFIFPARREMIFNFYFQDKWQVSQKLTLDLGLRVERERGSRPRHLGGFSNYNPANNTLELSGLGSIPFAIADTNDNFGPRLGIAYRLNDSTVIRTGYGISYYPRRMAQTNFPILQNNGFPTANPLFSTNVTMTTGFPPFSPFILPSSGVIENPNLNANFGSTQRNLVSPYVQSWNFSIQRALPWKLALDLAYVGNRGVNNQSDYNMNASMVAGSGNNGRPLFPRFRRVADTTVFVGTNTWYNSFQMKLDRRLSSGLFLTTAYTFSKGLNYSEDNGAVAIPMSLALNKARMQDNRTHLFTQSYIYELPFGRGKMWAQSGPAQWVFGGWQFIGGLSLMTGRWDTATVASTLNAPGNATRPNWLTPVRYLGAAGPGEKFIDTSSFAIPAQNTLGNAGRDIIQGPGLVDLTAALHRQVRLREGMELAFRIESFNCTNTPHYNNPNLNLNSAQFGEINSAMQDQRQYQIGLTLRF
jgi:hypothetical protein